jgi:hypothetical protein
MMFLRELFHVASELFRVLAFGRYFLWHRTTIAWKHTNSFPLVFLDLWDWTKLFFDKSPTHLIIYHWSVDFVGKDGQDMEILCMTWSNRINGFYKHIWTVDLIVPYVFPHRFSLCLISCDTASKVGFYQFDFPTLHYQGLSLFCRFFLDHIFSLYCNVW